jgi:hypothetical protein
MHKKYAPSNREKLDTLIKNLSITDALKKEIDELIDEVENDAWGRGIDAAYMD